MDDTARQSVQAAAREHAERVVASVESRWGAVERLDPLLVEPLGGQEGPFPESVEAFHERFYPYAAGAVVTDEAGRLLCVYSPARDEWETPGGAGDPGETPAETARRETREETGVEAEITGVCFVQLMTIDLGPPETLPVPVVSFTAERAGGRELTDAEIAAHEEVTDLAWFGPDELPAEVRNYDQKHAHLRTMADGP